MSCCQPPPKDDVVLSALPPESIREAAALAAAAFDQSPPYLWLCRGKSNAFRQRFLRWIFERNFRLRVGARTNRAVFDGDGKLVAFCMFVTPEVPDVSLADMIRAGLLGAPFLFGPAVVKRLLAMKAEYEQVEHGIMEAHGNVPMCRLERMVVRPDAQGRGIGRRALQQALVEADEANLPVLLSTQEERNVRFYRRLGFEVVRTDEHQEAYTSWAMLRQPRGSASF